MAKNKIPHVDALAHVNTRIGGCFGTEDKIFNTHPFDEVRSKELRNYAFANDITVSEVCDAANRWLQQRGCIKEHIDEQMAEVRAFFAKSFYNKKLQP